MAEYIEREALVEGLRKYQYPYGVEFLVSCQPAADVEPVTHGRWLPQILLGERVWGCSECKTLGSPQWKGCPVCLARMDGEG